MVIMLERLRITYKDTESVDVARCKVVEDIMPTCSHNTLADVMKINNEVEN